MERLSLIEALASAPNPRRARGCAARRAVADRRRRAGRHEGPGGRRPVRPRPRQGPGPPPRLPPRQDPGRGHVEQAVPPPGRRRLRGRWGAGNRPRGVRDETPGGGPLPGADGLVAAGPGGRAQHGRASAGRGGGRQQGRGHAAVRRPPTRGHSPPLYLNPKRKRPCFGRHTPLTRAAGSLSSPVGTGPPRDGEGPPHGASPLADGPDLSKPAPGPRPPRRRLLRRRRPQGGQDPRPPRRLEGQRPGRRRPLAPQPPDPAPPRPRRRLPQKARRRRRPAPRTRPPGPAARVPLRPGGAELSPGEAGRALGLRRQRRPLLPLLRLRLPLPLRLRRRAPRGSAGGRRPAGPGRPVRPALPPGLRPLQRRPVQVHRRRPARRPARPAPRAAPAHRRRRRLHPVRRPRRLPVAARGVRPAPALRRLRGRGPGQRPPRLRTRRAAHRRPRRRRPGAGT